jgi:hypothetical protein
MLTGSSASVSISLAPNCLIASFICHELDFRQAWLTLRTALNPVTNPFATRVTAERLVAYASLYLSSPSAGLSPSRGSLTAGRVAVDGSDDCAFQ